MKRILALVLVLSLTLAFMAGIAEEKKYRIAYSVMSLDNAYFVEISNGAKQYAEQQGNIEVIIHDGGLDVNRQIDAIETWIEQGVDAICITPVDPVALEPYVKQAQDAGIPVIGCNQPIKGTDAFVTIEEYFYGTLRGQMIAEYVNANYADRDEVTLVLFTWPMIEVLIQRAEGLKDTLAKLSPKVKVIAEPQANTAADGMAAIEAVMQKFETFDLVTANDSVGVAVAEAITAAGRAEGVHIFGEDCTAEAVEKIREGGCYQGTVDIMPFATGQLYLEVAIRVINEGPIAEPIMFNYQFVDQSNVNELFPVK